MKNPFSSRKGQWVTLAGVAIMLVIVVVFLAMAGVLTQQLRKTVVTCENYNNTAYVWKESENLCVNASYNSLYNYTPNNSAYMVTAYGMDTTNTISGFLPTLGLIAVFIVIIGAIVGMLYLRTG